jgi:GT2 family glycosyltransferase
MLGEDGQIQDAGKWPDYSGLGIRATRDFNPEPPQAVYSWFSSAACCLYDSEKFKRLGGFDELFNPYYFEDADLCFRAWCSGWHTLYEPTSKVYHSNSITIKKHHADRKIQVIANRNKLYINFRFLSGANKWAFISLLLLKLLVVWAGKGWFYHSFIQFLKSYPTFTKKNKLIKGSNLKLVAKRIKMQTPLRGARPY